MRIDFDRIALGANPDSVVMIAPMGEVLYWSPGAEQTFGWSGAEALGQSLRRLLVPEPGQEQWRDACAKALRDGSVVFEAQWRRKDGVSIPLAGTLKTIDEAGEIRCLLLVQKDLTALVAARQTANVASGFGELLEAMPDGIVLVNPSGRIVFANACADRMFGYERGELLSHGVELLLAERQRAQHIHRREEYFANPQHRTMDVGLDLYGLRKNGSEFPIDISLNPLRTFEGVLAVAAIRDVTERKRIEVVLASKNAALERASSARDHFLSAMSHELRTPLNAVIGFAGMLQMQMPGPLNEMQLKHVATIKSSAHDLLQLINGVLDVARKNADAKVGAKPDAVD